MHAEHSLTGPAACKPADKCYVAAYSADIKEYMKLPCSIQSIWIFLTKDCTSLEHFKLK